MTTPPDDDEVSALESRLRQSGWTRRVSDQRAAATRKRRPVAPPPTRFGGLDGQIRACAQRLADSHTGYSWPTYRDIADVYGLAYDDAVRALMEARRLSGEPG